MNGTPLISLIVCTYNNSDLLRKTLESLKSQTLDRELFEVLVIDNNSTDGTSALVSSFESAGYCLRYFLEESQGLSYARNRGVKEARADLIAFTDDDAEPEKNWLINIVRYFEDDADRWSVGGKVIGNWESEPPIWLTGDMYPALSLRDYGDEARELAWPERLIGVNFSFRKSVFEELGLFDIRIGRIGTSLLGGEDTEIQERIHQSGGRVFYAPDVLVAHYVPSSRMTIKYFIKRAAGHAATQAIIDNRSKGLMNNYFICFRKLPANILAFAYFFWSLVKYRHFKHFIPLASALSYFWQTVKLTFR